MRRIIQYSIVAVALLIASCKNEEMIGPRIVNLYAPFEVTEHLSVSNKTPDFNTGSTVAIKAKFDKYVSWKLTITGKKSKASKVFTGEKPEVDVLWDGRSGSLPFFSLEDCNIELSYPNFADKTKDTASLSIKGLRNPDKNGILISNFTVNKTPTAWPSDWPVTVSGSSKPSSADGSPYIILAGKAWDPANQGGYIDYFTISAKAADVPSSTNYFPITEADPAKVYLNFMLYDSLADASLQDASLKVIVNEEGGISGSIDVVATKEGWEIKSFKYSDFKFSPTTHIPRPGKIISVQFVLISTATPVDSKNVRILIDHAIFTYNEPFAP